jgi:hypothetical protein
MTTVALRIFSWRKRASFGRQAALSTLEASLALRRKWGCSSVNIWGGRDFLLSAADAAPLGACGRCCQLLGKRDPQNVRQP